MPTLSIPRNYPTGIALLFQQDLDDIADSIEDFFNGTKVASSNLEGPITSDKLNRDVADQTTTEFASATNSLRLVDASVTEAKLATGVAESRSFFSEAATAIKFASASVAYNNWAVRVQTTGSDPGAKGIARSGRIDWRSVTDGLSGYNVFTLSSPFAIPNASVSLTCTGKLLVNVGLFPYPADSESYVEKSSSGNVYFLVYVDEELAAITPSTGSPTGLLRAPMGPLASLSVSEGVHTIDLRVAMSYDNNFFVVIGQSYYHNLQLVAYEFG